MNDFPEATETGAEPPMDLPVQPAPPAPPAPKKRRKRASSGPSPAAQRRADRKLIDHYDRLREASSEELHLLSVILEVTGSRKEEPGEIAVAVSGGAKPGDAMTLITRIRKHSEPVDQLLDILGLSDDERSRVWKVLAALGLIGGSPAPSDPTGTSKRMLDAFASIETHHEHLLERVTKLAKA